MLEELAEKYKTDKLEHGYIKYYEKYLPKKINSLLEFGTYKGASVRMWKEYYQSAEISTFDLFKEFDIQEQLKSEGIKAFKGDATYNEDLAQIDGTYDVIIEDSSHNSFDQQFIFHYSFFPLLNPGGVYVVEDLHCCKDKFYWNRGISRFHDTFLSIIQNGFNEPNYYFSEFTANMYKNMIKHIQLFDDKIAFIFKK